MRISTNEAVAAIYYALWQCGYEYARLERDAAHITELTRFAGDTPHPFFSKARQNTCEVYALWPRAALLETATFHVDRENVCFVDWDGLRKKIMAMPNVTDEERDDTFWVWLADFPTALQDVLKKPGFKRYMTWAAEWVQMQNQLHERELAQIEQCLAVCRERYASPLKAVQLLIDPIKCVYSADYHITGEVFVFSSGRFQMESVIHEYLHHVVHPAVKRHAGRIPVRDYPELDGSYYAAGPLYAFEEHVVRGLTRLAVADELPQDLESYMQKLLR